MEFKLGATLWQQPDARGGAAQQQISTEDFRERLGDTGVESGEVYTSQDFRKENEFAALIPTRFQVGDSGVLRTNDIVALYDLGQLAGHHLSYAPSGLDTGNEQFSLTELTPDKPLLRSGKTMPTADTSVALHHQETGAWMSSAVSDGEYSTPLEQARNSASTTLSELMVRRWPERSLMILPRESGLEIVLRDYHLTREESDQLARDLQSYFGGSDEPLEQIWVNGHCLWQRRPTQANQAKE